SFEGWTDVNGTMNGVGADANWGVLLTGDKPLIEGSDGAVAFSTTTGTAADGMYRPYILINNTDITPANYTINASMATTDNDGFGIVFGYVDESNYFRIGLRGQAGGNNGFQEGMSIQKV